MKAQFVLDTLAEKLDLNVEQEELTEHLIRRAQQAQVSPQDYANQIMQIEQHRRAHGRGAAGQGAGARPRLREDHRRLGQRGRPLRPRRPRAGHDHEGHDHDHEATTTTTSDDHEVTTTGTRDEADGEAYADETEAIAEVSGGAEVGDAGEAEGRADETVPGAQS